MNGFRRGGAVDYAVAQLRTSQKSKLFGFLNNRLDGIEAEARRPHNGATSYITALRAQFTRATVRKHQGRGPQTMKITPTIVAPKHTPEPRSCTTSTVRYS